jgi:glycogen(starch) synthase
MTTAAASATRSTRALWLTETFPPSRGGMAESCDRIVRGLRRRGVTVDVLHFTPAPRGRPWTIERQAGGLYLDCPLEGDPAHALNRAWSTLQPHLGGVTHVVAFGGSRPISAAPVFAAWLGVPLITLIRGNDFDAAVFSTRRRPVLAEALERSALVCAVSQDKVEKIAALHPDANVRWIPNGISASDWELAPSDLARARAFRERAGERRVLGLIGQLKAKKGGVFLLEALLRSGVADAFELVLAGWMEPELQEWLAAHELSVTTLPFLDRYELLPWYAACDWIAIPSFYDGLPNVLVEAAALGVPMIASRAGGMADVLVDGETALMFEPGDEARCAWALQRAARLPEPERLAMSQACRELARTELDGELEISRYVEALAQTALPLAAAR